MAGLTSKDFLHAVKDLPLSNLDRAVALLWWHSQGDHGISKTPKEIGAEIVDAGYPQQNITRLTGQLEGDPRTTKAVGGGFRIRISARSALDTEYAKYVGPRPAPESDAVLPTVMFKGTRGYIERVIYQLNVSYTYGLYDCCTVMCRRLFETLIIEVYEAVGRAGELKGGDGNFKMFAGLLAHLETDQAFHLGRNAKRGLTAFKALGDNSAHNRRFNASQDDIDRVRDDLRIAAEELLHLAKLK